MCLFKKNFFFFTVTSALTTSLNKQISIFNWLTTKSAIVADLLNKTKIKNGIHFISARKGTFPQHVKSRSSRKKFKKIKPLQFVRLPLAFTCRCVLIFFYFWFPCTPPTSRLRYWVDLRSFSNMQICACLLSLYMTSHFDICITLLCKWSASVFQVPLCLYFRYLFYLFTFATINKSGIYLFLCMFACLSAPSPLRSFVRSFVESSAAAVGKSPPNDFLHNRNHRIFVFQLRLLCVVAAVVALCGHQWHSGIVVSTSCPLYCTRGRRSLGH